MNPGLKLPLLLGLLILTLQGCFNVPPPVVVRPEKGVLFSDVEYHPDRATVYLYRPLLDPSNRLLLNIRVDGEPVNQLYGGTYIKLLLPEGEHWIESTFTDPARPNEQAFSLTVEKNRAYFVTYHNLAEKPDDDASLTNVERVRYEGYGKWYQRWAQLPEERAILQITDCRLMPEPASAAE